jgi:outer membrane autotransporter protein
VLNEGGAATRSDTLVVDGTSVGPGGATKMLIHNTGGAGALTLGNGILVVQVLDPSRSAPGVFALPAGQELRAGAFDYDLFHGGPSGNNTSDWFLRSSFIVGPIPPEQPIIPPLEPALPIDPPPEVLPPGVFPIIGPEIATYGVVQPIARQLGMTTLGTLHERVGDTSLYSTTGTPCPADGDARERIWRKAPAKASTDCLNTGWGPSVWGRVLGQQIDNRYRAFADPRASGQLLGFQSGIDLWRGEWMPGHRDAAGVYVAYANANVDVTGRVTNEALNGYVLRKTGTLNLDAWSGAAYWTHYGPGDWYVDAVAQATHYEGAASTQFARLATTGFGFVSSLETGLPIRLPVLGPGFVLEPQAQIVWQRVSFDDANDSLGEVALGTTSGASGRIGLRGRWTIVSDSGQVWQPYVRANLWRDWGARATTTYSGVDLVPLLEQANRLQLGGGLSVKVNTKLSFYANADYQLSVGDTDGGRRNGVRGAAGVRYTW